MTTRDPRIDPQPGDGVRVGGQMRRVIELRRGRLLIETPMTRFVIKRATWQEWCEQSGATAVVKTGAAVCRPTGSSR